MIRSGEHALFDAFQATGPARARPSLAGVLRAIFRAYEAPLVRAVEEATRRWTEALEPLARLARELEARS